ncbi:TolC family protein [Pedobacter panaciterrae]|jgi:NodT family efflux transporter outer membrane factor (OMF) lipoprotein|uniref:Efflux transporter outer membrane subunit n=1 Tax=Pedobacter panaciterrae TaxID=363849 RepID=A0ABU8NLE8_9SPHI|nr:efflux transporter outer membrane subunit [Pedobacter panaciterrae]NQX56332.1 efflux transporter outer membrane subunit [Pedobacter panaciterrae]
MKKYINTLAPLLVLVVLAGCKVSKDVAIPKAAIPENFRNASSSDTTSIGNVSVKNFFTEEGVQRLIDTALLRNYDMQIALKNIESAEVLFKQSKLGNIPELTLQVTANANRPSNNSLNGLSAGQFLKTKVIQDYNANVGLAWEADIWGKIKGQKQAALATYLQTSEARKAIQTRVVANVAQGYYRLLMMDAQMAVAKKNLLLNDSTLRIIHMQFDAGQVTSLAIQQAEAQQLVAAQLIPELEQNITIQENALRILTGQLPGAVERLASLEKTNIPSQLSSGVPSSMVSRRPDVKSAELSLNIANAKVGIAKASMYPSLSITASGGLNSFKASNWFNIPASLFGVVGGGLTQPIFQRRQLKSQYELAKIDREKVVLEFRQSVLNAVGEVSDELVKLEKLKLQYDISSKRVTTLQEAVKNANLLFRNGMATYLEVITAQSNSLQSELELAAIKTAQLNASVELYRSLGGGI